MTCTKVCCDANGVHPRRAHEDWRLALEQAVRAADRGDETLAQQWLVVSAALARRAREAAQ